MTKQVNETLARYDLTKASRLIANFVVDDLSNWYVRRSRRRFWKSEMGHDKRAAFQTLYECLITVSKLMAPMAPFIAEEIYRNLAAGRKDFPDSVHLATYPQVNEPAVDYYDESLEKRMDLVRRIVFLGRSLRNEATIKVRQPLESISILAHSALHRQLVTDMSHLILEELNVKEIKFVTDQRQLLIRKAEPIFKNLGPKFGKNVNKAADAIRAFSDADIASLLEHGSRILVIDGHEARIVPEDINLSTENKQGMIAATEGDLTVALDLKITEALRYEGLAREFVNRVQNMRKEAGYEVTDRIQIWLQASDEMNAAVEKQSDYIKNETLCESLQLGEKGGNYNKEWKIDEEKIQVGIAKIIS